MPSIIWVIGLAAVYFVEAKLALFLAIPPGNATPVWPASGIALAAVLVLGYRVWPGIWLGATLANATTKVSLATAASIGVGNTLEALLEAYLLRRFAENRNPFDRGRDVFVFGAVAGGLSCAVAATIGVSSLWLEDVLPGPAYALNWWTWWLGDLGGMIVVTPLLLTWWEKPGVSWDVRRRAEGLVLGALLVTSSLSIFGNWPLGHTTHSLPYLVLIFIGWTAFRFGPRETATAITAAVGIAIWGTVRRVGPFQADTLNESLLLLQAFVILVGVAGLAMAALVEERRKIEASLRTARDKLDVRVRERTADLANANEALIAENAERKRAEAALALRTRQLEAVRIISEEITRELHLSTLLHLITERAVELVGAAGGAIHLWDEATQLLTLGAWYGKGEWRKAVRLEFGSGVVGIVAVRQKGMVVTDYRTCPYALPFMLEQTRVTSMLAEPLLYHDRLLGVIGVDNEKSERVFIEEDREPLSLFASQAAIAIENARLFEAVRAGRGRLQTLSAKLVDVQEAERRKFGRELHDEIGQALTALSTNLQILKAGVSAGTLGGRLDESLEIVDRLLQKARAISLDLRPPMLDDLGLVAALRWYANHHAQQAGLRVRFVARVPETRLPSRLETTCFRVAQEALTNVIRHAQASEVRIELRQEVEVVELLVCDNGVGFDTRVARERAKDGQSFGLLGMEERVGLAGGHMVIESARGQGTEIRLRVPLASTLSPG